MNPFSFITDIVGKIADKFAPDKQKVADNQSNINLSEVSGAPVSILRLWRSFLGWVLALVFAWEVVGRGIIIPIFFPHLLATLPEPVAPLVTRLLFGMLGFGG